jgi:small subunit ribosomal protein S4e
MRLKRLAAPKSFIIPRKGKKFVACPRPGPHPKDRSVPLLIIIRDYLKYASTAREAEKIIKMRKVLIDGRVVTEPRFPVGLMDVISLPDINEHYRMIPIYKRGLSLIPIDEQEANFKLGMIVRKTMVNGGAIQFTLHDGRNLLFKNPSIDVKTIPVGDTFKISLPEQELLAHLELREGNYGLIIAGSRSGIHGKIIKIDRTPKYPAKPLIQIESSTGTISTILSYVMVVGENEPWLKLS